MEKHKGGSAINTFNWILFMDLQNEPSLCSMRCSVLLLCALQGDEDARGFFFGESSVFA